jgi:uncharacterized circularly permuted ATP-grasp superfamily protein
MSVVSDSHTVRPWRLLDGYHAADGVYDEMVGADSRLRPHYEGFTRALEALGRVELASRWENAKRTLRDNGVTYNVYGDPQGMDRPWGLDFVPFLITAEEWACIEAGLVQRSRLFNLILADIYGGSQRLLRDGFLPPELVYANPGFLRPVMGFLCRRVCICTFMQWIWRVRRTASGGCWPTGRRRLLAYALENRIVLLRSLRAVPRVPVRGWRPLSGVSGYAGGACPHRGDRPLTSCC